jgi:tetratricopeptide (TPR) repeat protein
LDLFDLWRFFGPLPDLPEEVHTLGADRVILALKAEYEQSGSSSGRFGVLLSAAMRAARGDILESFGEVDFSNPVEPLYRGKFRFYRTLAQNPDSPGLPGMEEAAADFRSVPDGAAGLVRIAAVTEGAKAAEKLMKRLLRSARYPGEAAGACLFMACLPGTTGKRQRQFLRRAVRRLARCGTESAVLLRARLEDGLAHHRRAGRRREKLAARGSLEARCLQLERDIEDLMREPPGPGVQLTGLRNQLLQRVAEYRKVRPSDPRAFLMEGRLLYTDDSETARMAWRSALVLDDHFPDAWAALGYLYRDAAIGCSGDLAAGFLESSRDSFHQAFVLNPLDPAVRLSWGIAEREAGQSARAVGILLGALALVPDNLDMRRQLAFCWTDLMYSEELDPAARNNAADRAAAEWERLVSSGTACPQDRLGLLRTLAAASSGDAEKRALNQRRIGKLARETLADYPLEDITDLIDPADDLQSAGFFLESRMLLDRVDEIHPGLPSALSVRAAGLEESDPGLSMKLYMEAAKNSLQDSPDLPELILKASEMADKAGMPETAVELLHTGLMSMGGNVLLLKRLSEKMLSGDGSEQAEAMYRHALAGFPDNLDLVDEAAWFFRDIGKAGEAEAILEKALIRFPGEARLWNQTGVHHMEAGWDDEHNEMNKERLRLAIVSYRRAVELDPENPVFLGNLGDSLRQAGDFTEASGVLERTVKYGGRGSDPAFAVNSLARLMDEKSYSIETGGSTESDWEHAGDFYLQAAQIGYENADYQRDYAWWLYRERRLDSAVEYYRRAQAADPHDSSFPYGEYACHLELGNLSTALEALNRSLSLDPADPQKLADLADITGSLGDETEAERIYLDVLRHGGEESWVLERLAEFRESRAEITDPEDPAAVVSIHGPVFFPAESLICGCANPEAVKWRSLALESWEKALDSEPGSRHFKARCGGARMALGLTTGTRELLIGALSADSPRENADVLNRLGRLDLFEAAGTGSIDLWESSGNRLSAAAEAYPSVASFHAYLGYRYHLANDDERAFHAFAHAADRNPAYPEYAANAGICAWRSGRFAEGSAFLQRALSKKDHVAEWQNALGLCLLGTGDSAESLEAFRRASLLDPDNESYVSNIALAHMSLHTPRGLLQ